MQARPGFEETPSSCQGKRVYASFIPGDEHLPPSDDKT
jgi:hypothetical protein